MEVIAVTGTMARCRAKGVERDVSLFLLEDRSVVPGDHVLVHVGYAIQTVDAVEARTTWELLDRMLAADDAQDAP
jgi:hydrogenase expression/formation protein HypC